MTRKQRRALGRSGAQPPLDAAPNTAPAESLANLFAAAVAQHQAGALTEAERRYRHILALFPSHADSLHNLGLVALQGGDAASAVDLIGRAIAVDDRIAEYHFTIAGAWRALNRIDHVATHLERTIELRSDHALAHLNLGNVRRQQGRPADAIACYEHAIALSPRSAAARSNLANVLSEQGQWDAAIAHYRQALALEPNHAETHSRLGAALVARGSSGEAVPHFETALALKPDLAEAHENLGKAYLSAGQLDLAAHAARRALELKETPQRKALFAQCVKLVRFTADDGGFRKLVLRAHLEGWISPRELTGVCLSLVRLDGVVNDAIARANSAWPARLPAAELFRSPAMAALAQDQLLRCLIECDPVSDVGLERLLTNVRHAMATTAAADDVWDASVLDFCCAVARQCFINEYVFSMTEAEADLAQRLRASLEKALASGDSIPALWPVVVGAYFPLHTLANAQALLERSWPQCIGALLVQQVKEPAEELRLAAGIPALTVIEDEVSRVVRQQYEENPYPRWVRAGQPGQPDILPDRRPQQAVDVLIAGCGTGLSTIEFARQMPAARVLAVDLSLASLSYAKRMAQSHGLTNIEFGQADIMRLASVGREFDFIDATGVLHHLADPWEGWRVLLARLRQGGVMQLGLYSELARQNVVAARALIAERGYRPIPEDIRRCREEIMAAADGSALKSVIQWQDFFTTNECRDLLFHVQEHRMTLPQIKAFLAANGVEFSGFIQEPSQLRRFVARFPDRAALLDLDCWHRLETEDPRLFSAMYQFWVRKPAGPADLASVDSA